MKKLLDGKIECHHTCPDHGRDANLELPNETRYGRLLVNTELYPCLKREFLSLEAIRLSRLGKMQIKGREQKKLIEAIEGLNRKEKSNYNMER